MTKCYGLEHRTTGEFTTVCDLTGISEEKWKITELSRHPKDDEKFDGTKLVKDENLSKALKKNQARNLSRQEYVYKVIKTLFPTLVISKNQMDELFPDL